MVPLAHRTAMAAVAVLVEQTAQMDKQLAHMVQGMVVSTEAALDLLVMAGTKVLAVVALSASSGPVQPVLSHQQIQATCNISGFD
jgi:hypothetical protein